MALRSGLNGFQRGFVGAIGILFAQFWMYRPRNFSGIPWLYSTGRCSLPLNIGPTVATQLVEMRNIAADRRIAVNQWPMESQSSNSKDFFEAKGNAKRARVRLALVETPRGRNEDRDQDGNIISGPSDDEWARREGPPGLVAAGTHGAIWKPANGNPITDTGRPRPYGVPSGRLSGGHEGPPLQRPGGLSTRRGDQCPIGISRKGLPIGRTPVRAARGQRAHPRSKHGRVRAGT